MATYDLQPDATAGLDTQMFSGAALTNYGTSTNAGVKYNKPLKSASGPMRTIIEFDLSAFPGASSDITAAQLTLVAQAAHTSEGAKVRRITQAAWTEGGCTWTTYDGTNNWTTAGGDYTTTDQVSWTTPGATGSFDITGMATLTIDAIDNRSNRLIILLMLDDETTASTRGCAVYTSDDTTASNRPKLTIEYTVAGVTEVWTATLMGPAAGASIV